MSACLREEEEGEEGEARPWSPRDNGTSTLPPPSSPSITARPQPGPRRPGKMVKPWPTRSPGGRGSQAKDKPAGSQAPPYAPSLSQRQIPQGSCF